MIFWKVRPNCFICFPNLVRFWEDFPTELSAHPLQTIFSDFGLEEELGVDEQVAWEAQLDGSVDPEGDV